MKAFLNTCLLQLANSHDDLYTEKLIRAIQLAAIAPNTSASATVLLLIRMIKTCSSHKRMLNLLEAVLVILETKDVLSVLPKQTVMECFAILCTLVTDQSYKIRSMVLCVCKKFCAIESTQSYSLEVIVSFLKDDNPVVQQTCFLLLIDIWSHSEIMQFLDHEALLVTVGIALKNDSLKVRRPAAIILWHLVQKYSDSKKEQGFKSGSLNSNATLCNNAFVQLCDLVNDDCPDLRAMSLRLMGTMEQVSTAILWQTLSKQIGNIRKLSGGQKIASTQDPNNAGDYEISDDKVSLLDSAMCGAFIHGLEDEYSIVRASAIDAMCELACIAKEFANLSIPFLVDMFNDEHKEIRLNAITSVTKISVVWRFSLKAELTETITLALFDSDAQIRQATHTLIGIISVDTPAALKKLLDVLQQAMRIFPLDKLSILHAFAYLGQAHATLVEDLIPLLLRLDTRFLPQAIRTDDINHTCNMILILNGCASKPDLTKQLPLYAKEQYSYLREQYGAIIPTLNSFSGNPLPILHETKDMADFDIRPSLEKHCVRFETTPNRKLDSCKTIEMMNRDLKLLAQKNIPQSVLYEFLSHAIFQDHDQSFSDLYSGIPESILENASSPSKSIDYFKQFIWQVPIEIRKKKICMETMGEFPTDLHGQVQLKIPLSFRVSNILDLATLSIQIMLGDIVTVCNSFTSHPARFLRPLEWMVDMEIPISIAYANGPVSITIACKVREVTLYSIVKRFEFKS
ncbi:hypothetical protein BDV3_004610 [Batrachochytrium dendrobatidis]|nr:Integrator complex subunit 4 [Batrachochytrium dendrobatidis]KAK5672621.1 Integrator complex subunit 4 [Batrachochytrium dendrobatidis]OAJ39229.1 hypothetical protein BDEG_23091 [Batrachochytrium dendrobatidis JEL423]